MKYLQIQITIFIHLNIKIYGKPTIHPCFEFMTKERLKKHMTFTKKIYEKDYKKIPFGIRLEFIDTEAFRISYIITIE